VGDYFFTWGGGRGVHMDLFRTHRGADDLGRKILELNIFKQFSVIRNVSAYVVYKSKNYQNT
jgi:hypothetical protein